MEHSQKTWLSSTALKIYQEVTSRMHTTLIKEYLYAPILYSYHIFLWPLVWFGDVKDAAPLHVLPHGLGTPVCWDMHTLFLAVAFSVSLLKPERKLVLPCSTSNHEWVLEQCCLVLASLQVSPWVLKFISRQIDDISFWGNLLIRK